MVKYGFCSAGYPPLAGVTKGRGWTLSNLLKVFSSIFFLLLFHGALAQTLGERIDGPANIRSAANGDLTFSLNNNVLVGAGPIQNGWAEIQITIEIPFKIKDNYSLDSGKAIVDIAGDTLGFILGDVMTSIANNGKTAWCSFYGYTHQNNIREESIIENVVQKNIERLEFNHLAWSDFIEDFGLQQFDSIGGYEIFMTYESIDDSPGFRIALLFENYNLVGIIHSRPIPINQRVKDYKVDDYLSVLFVDNYSKQKVLAFQNTMLTWLNGVD